MPGPNFQLTGAEVSPSAGAAATHTRAVATVAGFGFPGYGFPGGGFGYGYGYPAMGYGMGGYGYGMGGYGMGGYGMGGYGMGGYGMGGFGYRYPAVRLRLWLPWLLRRRIHASDVRHRLDAAGHPELHDRDPALRKAHAAR